MNVKKEESKNDTNEIENKIGECETCTIETEKRVIKSKRKLKSWNVPKSQEKNCMRI